MSTEEELKNKSAEQLANWQSGWKPRTPYDILAEKEWQRRFMLEQHELDKHLLKQQVKWMKFSAIIGFIGILIGAIITALAVFLSTNIQATKQIESLKPTIQQQNGQKTSEYQIKTTSKSSSETPKKK